MARYQRKIPPADLASAKSWMKKFVCDTRLQELGIVHDVTETAYGVRLLARFPGESTSRPIALEAVADGEYLMPGDVKARYRPMDEADRAKVSKLANSAS